MTTTTYLLPLASVLIGALIRILKKDGPLPAWMTIPDRARPWVAIALGIVVGGVDKLATGAPWSQVWPMLLSGAAAVLGHELGIESLRGGKEIPLSASDVEPPKPPAPGVGTRISGLMLALVVSMLVACPAAKDPASLDLRDPKAMRAILALEKDAILEANKVCRDVTRVLSIEAEHALNLDGVKRAAAVNKECSLIAEDAHTALLTGQAVLDAYEAGMEGRIGCAAGAGVAALRQIRNLVESVSTTPLPPSVEQAIDGGLMILSIAAPACPLPPPSNDAGADVAEAG